MKIKPTNNSGQTLLEALIALSLLSIVLGATAIAVLSSVNNSVFTKQQNQANKYAQQGVEYIRDQIANNNMLTCYSSLNTQCFNDLASTTSSSNTQCNNVPTIFVAGHCASANLGLFKREVTFAYPTNCGGSGSFSNGMQVTVDVYWTSTKCTQSFCNKQEVRSCFLNPGSSGQIP